MNDWDKINRWFLDIFNGREIDFDSIMPKVNELLPLARQINKEYEENHPAYADAGHKCIDAWNRIMKILDRGVKINDPIRPSPFTIQSRIIDNLRNQKVNGTVRSVSGPSGTLAGETNFMLEFAKFLESIVESEDLKGNVEKVNSGWERIDTKYWELPDWRIQNYYKILDHLSKRETPPYELTRYM